MNRKTPELSIVVISYNMARELPRTLYTLSPAYQRHIERGDYEVILVDNGSQVPPTLAQFTDLGINLQVHSIPDAGPSPVRAINFGLARATAPVVGVMIDGARMVSPGLLDASRRAARLDPRAVISVVSFHLGPTVQWQSMQYGYNQIVEDRMLAAVDWQSNGYLLFEHAPAAENAPDGWFGRLLESNALFMNRTMWDELGGYDPGFDSPGGGAVNPDTMWRALDLPQARQVVLLGEATFHQFHGGVATNSGLDTPDFFQAASREYYRLRRRALKMPALQHERTYYGPVGTEACVTFQRLLGRPIQPAINVTAGKLGKVGSASATPDGYLKLLKMILLNEHGLEVEAALQWLFTQPGVPDRFWTDILFNAPESIGDILRKVRQERENGGQSHGVGVPCSLTMIGRRRLEHLEQCVNTVLDEGIPGDLMECGVWRGGACMMMKALLDLRRAVDRRVWVADSFQGLPKPSVPEDDGLDLSGSRFPHLIANLTRVEESFRALGLLDGRVRFVPGWFEDTLPACTVEQLALLRLDGDLYSSTMVALESLYDKVSLGGFIIIDDYALPVCSQAVADFRAARGITAPIKAIDWTGAFWRKV